MMPVDIPLLVLTGVTGFSELSVLPGGHHPKAHMMADNPQNPFLGLPAGCLRCSKLKRLKLIAEVFNCPRTEVRFFWLNVNNF
jgi:hypothetical protein